MKFFLFEMHDCMSEITTAHCHNQKIKISFKGFTSTEKKPSHLETVTYDILCPVH